jgi:hypothetical protein
MTSTLIRNGFLVLTLAGLASLALPTAAQAGHGSAGDETEVGSFDALNPHYWRSLQLEKARAKWLRRAERRMHKGHYRGAREAYREAAHAEKRRLIQQTKLERQRAKVEHQQERTEERTQRRHEHRHRWRGHRHGPRGSGRSH